MLILLSPSKTQDFESPAPVPVHTEPAFLGESMQLIKALRPLSTQDIGALMHISEKLAALNHARYREFSLPFTPRNAKQAIFAFQGDVYDGLQAHSLDSKALAFAQERVRILSGLYGVLRPLDLIQPYRLEMKTKLNNPRGQDLYAFWGDRLTDLINEQLQALDCKIVVNLASEEYFKAVKVAKLAATVITPQFKEKKGAAYKMIALFAKRARGHMAHYIAQQQVTDPEALRFFSEDGYRYNVALSTPASPVYTRAKNAPLHASKPLITS